MELAIDTATDMASIALSHRSEVRAEMTWPSGQNHTVELVPNLIHLLHQAKAEIPQIDAIIVTKGPGSFTGLRVGVGTAKGLAFALGTPLVGIGTLEVEAFPHAEVGLPICPLLDAGRGEVATALYQLKRGKWLKLTEEHITTIEELCLKINTRTLFCGLLSSDIAQQIERRLGKRAVILKASLRRAGSLAQLGWRRLERDECDNPATLQPLYLRRPVVTTSKKRIEGRK